MAYDGGEVAEAPAVLNDGRHAWPGQDGYEAAVANVQRDVQPPADVPAPAVEPDLAPAIEAEAS